MTTPQLSAPVLLHPSELKAHPRLIAQIINLTNDAFLRSKMPDPVKWNLAPGRRFPTRESYHDMLVDETIVALIFDRNASIKDIRDSLREDQGSVLQMDDGELRGKVVACAAATPWSGGWAKEGAGKETGFEIKAIAVEGDARYLRKGLAVQVMASLENHLIEQLRQKLQETLPKDPNFEKPGKQGCLTTWIMAAECINGAYWRKRGYREVRRTTEGAGTWGCKTNFDLVVLRKDVEFDAST
jgi:hypothetical protein